MNKKIVYVLTWFPMFSETFVYNEIKCLAQQRIDIAKIVVLNRHHDDVSYDLSSMDIIFPPNIFTQVSYFVLYALLHPITVLKLIAYIYKIHRGDLFRLKRGYTSFIKGILLLPLILWINKILGTAPIHFHAHFPGIATTTAMTLAKLRQASFSFTGHGTDILEYGPNTLGYRINKSQFFITVSEYNKTYIINNYKDVQVDKIHVIPAVVDTDIFKKIRKTLNKKPEVVQLITVARLSPEKGHEIFLRALARFYQERRDFFYTIIGDGELRETLQELVRDLGIAEKVRFCGFCNRDFILEAFRNSHLFVLTSYREGLPVGLMEALAAGLPVFATRITAIPEIVQRDRNGILVEPGDEADMYRGLQSLAANNWEKLSQLSRFAINQDDYHFDIKSTVPRIKELLESCIK